MTSKRETQIIVVGTVVGLGVIVSGYLWLQNQLFPPGTQESLERFQKQVGKELAKPSNKHYHASIDYFEKGKYDLALEEAKRALEAAVYDKDETNIGMAHLRLFKTYLAMGDTVNAEKELDWLDEDVRKSGAWDIQKNATQTLGDIQTAYRRRLEELKKSQQASPPATAKTEDLEEVR